MFNMTDEARLNLIEAWVEKNKPKRYQHGERPEGEVPCEISVWGKSPKKSAAEKQAELDALGLGG